MLNHKPILPVFTRPILTTLPISTIVGALVLLFLVFDLDARRSEVLAIPSTALTNATLDHVTLNPQGELVLSRDAQSILSPLDADVVWETLANEQKNILWVAGGSDGNLSAIQLQPAEDGETTDEANSSEIIWETNLPYPEVTALAAFTNFPNHLFLANGPNGAVYTLPTTEVTTQKDDSNSDIESPSIRRLTRIDEPFIWDMLAVSGANAESGEHTLYLATGGKTTAAVYRVILPEDLDFSTYDPLPAEKLFSLPEANAVRLFIDGETLLITSAPASKLYAYNLRTQTQNILYDSQNSEITAITQVLAAEKSAQKNNTNPLSTLYFAVQHNAASSSPQINGNGTSRPGNSLGNRGNGSSSLQIVGRKIRNSSLPNPNGQHSASSTSGPCSPPSACRGGISGTSLYELTLSSPPRGEFPVPTLRRLIGLSVENVIRLIATGEDLLYATLSDSLISRISLKSLEHEELHFEEDSSLADVFYVADTLYFLSMSPASLSVLSPNTAREGTLTSDVIAFNETVQFGRFVADLTFPPITQSSRALSNRLSLETRSGHSEKIDSESSLEEDTAHSHSNSHWSPWTALSRDGKVLSPPAPFMQFRLTLTTGRTNTINHVSPRLAGLKLYYSKLNHPPTVSALKIQYMSPDHFQQPPIPPPPNVIGAPTVFTPLDFLAPLTLATRRYLISWNPTNLDGDVLRYTLSIKHLGDPNGHWTVLQKNFFTNTFMLDHRDFPDGIYQLKLTYDDFLSNGSERGFIRERLSLPHVIDNTPPQIDDIERTTGGISFLARDDLSVITRAFYSFDRENYYELAPIDGIYDSEEESFSLALPADLSKGENAKTPIPLVIIAVDAAGNVSFAYPSVPANR